MASKQKIRKGMKVKVKDRNTGKIIQVTIHAHLVSDYWQAIDVDGMPVDVKETEILSFVDEPEPAGPGKKREVQGDLFDDTFKSITKPWSDGITGH